MIKSELEISHNACIKEYPDFTKVAVANRRIWKEKGYELITAVKKKAKYETPITDLSKRIADSQRRAKQGIYDICNLNDFQYFITLTFSPEQIDRSDFEECLHKTLNFLRWQVTSKGASYLMIPELHENLDGVHFHILYNGELNLEFYKVIKKRAVYNITNWKLGFSTCVIMDGNKQSIGNYLRKYVTKNENKVFKHYYYCSNNLIKQPCKKLCDFPYSSFEGKEYSVPYLDGVSIKYATIKNS